MDDKDGDIADKGVKFDENNPVEDVSDNMSDVFKNENAKVDEE